MDRIWLKNPLAVFTATDPTPGRRGRRGGARIVELVPAGGTPVRASQTFDASRHVVLPGPDQHAPPLLPNAHPSLGARGQHSAVPVADEPLSRLGAAHPGDLELATTVALAELLLSGCTTAADHHYLFPDGMEDAIDVQVEVGPRMGVRVC